MIAVIGGSSQVRRNVLPCSYGRFSLSKTFQQSLIFLSSDCDGRLKLRQISNDKDSLNASSYFSI